LIYPMRFGARSLESRSQCRCALDRYRSFRYVAWSEPAGNLSRIFVWSR